MNILHRIVLPACLVLGATFAVADDFDKAVASLLILQNPKVQTDMKVTQAQKDKMNAAAKTFNEGMTKLSTEFQAQLKKNPKATPDQAKQGKLIQALKVKIMAVLSDAQIKRLREISLQALGVGALGDTMVSKKVGLSTAQVTKVRSLLTDGLNKATKIQQAAQTKVMAGLKEPKTDAEKKKVTDEINKRMQKLAPQLNKDLAGIRTSTEKSVLAQLSSGQLAAWKALNGKIFTP